MHQEENYTPWFRGPYDAKPFELIKFICVRPSDNLIMNIDGTDV